MSASDHTHLLDVQHLSIRFPGSPPVVHDLSFHIQRSEVLGVVGESGSGKTLTALAVMGLLPPGAGLGQKSVITFRPQTASPQALHELSPRQWTRIRGKQIAMIFQEPMTALNPVMRCGRQVAEVLMHQTTTPKTSVRKEVLQWFKRVQLPDHERIYQAYPHQLSGGQQQRVLIAMAMIGQPELLIADEPTTALDVRVQQDILRLLKKLQRDFDLSILFITHDLGVIRSLADRVLVLKNGRQMEVGAVETLFSRPKTSYTRNLIHCRPPLNRRPHRLPTLNEQEASAPVTASSYQPAEELQLRAEDLKVSYPLRRNWWGKTKEYLAAVDQVSFYIRAGETLGLVGESGCGKTSLGRAIMGLTPISGGRLWFAEEDISHRIRNDQRRLSKSMQMIFQDPYASLNPRLTVGETIVEPMRLHGIGGNEKERQDRAVDLLERVGMQADHRGRLPGAFSGGQRQRIAIARALAVEPKLIVCDEAVSALDVSVQAQVLNLMRDLQERYQLSYLFISHDWSVVRFMSHRVAVMYQGKIVETGPAATIYERAQSAYTQSLIDAVPDVSDASFRWRV